MNFVLACCQARVATSADCRAQALTARAAPQVCGTAGSRRCLAGGSAFRSAQARRVCARRGLARARAAQAEEGKPQPAAVGEDDAPKQSGPGAPGAPGVAKLGSAAGAPKLTFGTNANAVRAPLPALLPVLPAARSRVHPRLHRPLPPLLCAQGALPLRRRAGTQPRTARGSPTSLLSRCADGGACAAVGHLGKWWGKGHAGKHAATAPPA